MPQGMRRDLFDLRKLAFSIGAAQARRAKQSRGRSTASARYGRRFVPSVKDGIIGPDGTAPHDRWSPPSPHPLKSASRPPGWLDTSGRRGSPPWSRFGSAKWGRLWRTIPRDQMQTPGPAAPQPSRLSPRQQQEQPIPRVVDSKNQVMRLESQKSERKTPKFGRWNRTSRGGEASVGCSCNDGQAVVHEPKATNVFIVAGPETARAI